MYDLARFGKALGDPTRVRILNLLRQADLCVCELVDALELGQSTLSTQLQVLRQAGVVRTEKRRSWIIYSVEPAAREPLEALFQRFGPDDDRTRRDIARCERRLHLRVDGCCVLGSGQLEKELVETR